MIVIMMPTALLSTIFLHSLDLSRGIRNLVLGAARRYWYITTHDRHFILEKESNLQELMKNNGDECSCLFFYFYKII